MTSLMRCVALAMLIVVSCSAERTVVGAMSRFRQRQIAAGSVSAGATIPAPASASIKTDAAVSGAIPAISGGSVVTSAAAPASGSVSAAAVSGLSMAATTPLSLSSQIASGSPAAGSIASGSVLPTSGAAAVSSVTGGSPVLTSSGGAVVTSGSGSVSGSSISDSSASSGSGSSSLSSSSASSSSSSRRVIIKDCDAPKGCTYAVEPIERFDPDLKPLIPPADKVVPPEKNSKGEFKPAFLEEEIAATPVVPNVAFSTPIFVETAAELSNPVSADVIGQSVNVAELDSHFMLTPELAGTEYDLGFDKKHGLAPSMSVSTIMIKRAEKLLPLADKRHDEFEERHIMDCSGSICPKEGPSVL